MYKLIAIFLITTAVVSAADEAASPEAKSSTPQPPPQPVYKQAQQPPQYIPHQTYPYADPYGFFYSPVVQPQAYSEEPAEPSYMPAVIPATQVDSVPEMLEMALQIMGAVQIALKVLAKFGLFLLGGTALLVIGGIFTTIICHLTPICVISFPALGGFDKESVRSLMTPDKISAAAALVQDAIGKYQRLQRAVKV